jgi:hypothetical protein
MKVSTAQQVLSWLCVLLAALVTACVPPKPTPAIPTASPTETATSAVAPTPTSTSVSVPTSAPEVAWLVIEGMDFYAGRPGTQVRVTASVNDTEYIYPSVGGVQWLEVGPGMSAQKFRLPPADETYTIRFEAAVRVPGENGEPDTLGTLTSVEEDIVNIAEDIPFSGRYVLHTLDPVHMSRSAQANAEIAYLITYDP